MVEPVGSQHILVYVDRTDHGLDRLVLHRDNNPDLSPYKFLRTNNSGTDEYVMESLYEMFKKAIEDGVIK